MAEQLTVHCGEGKVYDIVIEPSYERLGKKAANALDLRNHKICIVSDENVAPLYADAVREQFEPLCGKVDLWVFPAGEEYKNLDVVRSLYRFLIENHYDRSDYLAALGGGVVGDLCGFAAATYLRGIEYVQLPTTLLAQVDSSIGGKTGVDFDAFKNMVGAFHMPSLVYTCTQTLKTLPDEQFACGMGEVIKHGLICDPEYFDWLGHNVNAINSRDPDICEQMILVSDNIKREIVERDPTEKGDRAFLNFGHTLGHAIEKLMNFQLYHGQCVALGIMAACYISKAHGSLTDKDIAVVSECLHRFRLPTDLSGKMPDPEKIIEATKNDKKMESGTVKFILLNGIGEAYIDRTVTEDEMREALARMAGDTV